MYLPLTTTGRVNVVETPPRLVDTARSGPARGCAPRNAETSVIKTHVSRGFSWNARPNALRCRCNGWRPQLRDQPQDVGKESSRNGDFGHLESNIATWLSIFAPVL